MSNPSTPRCAFCHHFNTLFSIYGDRPILDYCAHLEVRGPCVVTGKPYSFPITQDQARRIIDYLSAPLGTLIQGALPDLTAAQREFIITGTAPEGWTQLFPDAPDTPDLLDDPDPTDEPPTYYLCTLTEEELDSLLNLLQMCPETAHDRADLILKFTRLRSSST